MFLSTSKTEQNSIKAYNKKSKNSIGMRANITCEWAPNKRMFCKRATEMQPLLYFSVSPAWGDCQACVSALCWEQTHKHTQRLSLRHKCWWGHLSWIIPPVHGGTQPNTVTVSENTSTISGRRPHWALQRGVNYRLWGGVAEYAKNTRRMDNRITEANRLLFATRCNEMQYKRSQQEKAEEVFSPVWGVKQDSRVGVLN